jgi:hypothetical protein
VSAVGRRFALPLLAVVVGGDLLDLRLDLLDADLDSVGIAGAVDDRAALLGQTGLSTAARLKQGERTFLGGSRRNRAQAI